METILPIIIQLVAGAVAGNVGGALKNINLGAPGNTVAGGVGGVLLGQLLPLLTSGNLETLLQGVVGQAATGGTGGILFTIIAGVLKNLLAGKPQT